MGQASNPAEAVTDIEQRRLALQRLVVIGHSLEQLNSGLQSTLLMGRPTGSIPQSALTAFAQLDEKTSIMPDAKLKHTVDVLESSIKSKVSRIIETVLLDDEQLVESSPGGGSSPAMPDLPKILGEFRKNAQTAVALKVVLKKRGVPTKPMVISVPEDEIRRHIEALKAKEKTYRGQIISNIEDMMQDTRGILGMKHLSEDLRGATQRVLDDLEANLQHLKAGKSMETLPMALEVIEMDHGLPLEEDLPVEKESPHAEIIESNGEKAPPAPGPATASSARPGLFKSLLLWFKSPTEVTWADIRQGRFKP
jgi:hypothetical protein